MSDEFAFGLLLGAVALIVLGILIMVFIVGDDDDEPVDELARARGDYASAVDGLLWRQRYECSCGWHGTKETRFPPSHIKCGRCGGVAVPRDRKAPT